MLIETGSVNLTPPSPERDSEPSLEARLSEAIRAAVKENAIARKKNQVLEGFQTFDESLSLPVGENMTPEERKSRIEKQKTINQKARKLSDQFLEDPRGEEIVTQVRSVENGRVVSTRLYRISSHTAFVEQDILEPNGQPGFEFGMAFSRDYILSLKEPHKIAA